MRAEQASVQAAAPVVVPAIAVTAPPSQSNLWAAALPPMQATAVAAPMMIAEQDMRAAQAPPTAPAEPAAHTTTRLSRADSDARAEADVMAPYTPAVQVPEMHEEQVQDTPE